VRDDPELIDLAINHPKFGKEFFFHKDHVPEGFGDTPRTAIQLTSGLKLSSDTKASYRERARRIEDAKFFDKEYHKEGGDFGIIVEEDDAETVGKPVNEAPNPISEW